MRWPRRSRGRPAARRRRLRARRLALHPRVLHRHGGAHAAQHAGPAARSCTSPSRSSSSRTTLPTWTRARRTCAPGWSATCAAMTQAQRDFAAQLRPAHAPHADRRGSRARRRQQRGRHLARHDGRALRAARPGGGGHRFAHAAQRRARLRGIRRRHDRHGQCVRDRCGAHDGAARCCGCELDGAATAGRHRQGHRAAPAGASRHSRRRWRRQGVRVRGRGGRAAFPPTSEPRSPT